MFIKRSHSNQEVTCRAVGQVTIFDHFIGPTICLCMLLDDIMEPHGLIPTIQQRSGYDPDTSLRMTQYKNDKKLIRPAVQTRTSWGAPIIWELMFDPKLYDAKHQEGNSSVAITVFAVGRYLDAYLNTFLTSAEKHFMIGLPVTYYVFTDLPEKVPKYELAPLRELKIVKVQKYNRWQDISMMRMKIISEMIDSEFQGKFDYLFCFDVDQEFKARFGSEALGESVALLHAHFYKLPKYRFTYDKQPKSRAYMKEGDYYYHAAIFGGSLDKVKALADFCHLSIMEDKLNDVEALWHDESHLNKYFWLNKPSRLLSPEYCWDPIIGDKRDILITRLTWAPKQYSKLRTR